MKISIYLVTPTMINFVLQGHSLDVYVLFNILYYHCVCIRLPEDHYFYVKLRVVKNIVFSYIYTINIYTYIFFFQNGGIVALENILKGDFILQYRGIKRFKKDIILARLNVL